MGNMLSKTEKRGEEKDLETRGRAWFRNNTIHQWQNVSCVSSFLFLHCKKKKNQHKRGFLGTSYLTFPEMEKRILRGKRRDNSICRCYFPSQLSENFIAVKGIHKKKKKKNYHWCNLSTSPTNLALHKTQWCVWNAVVSKPPRQCF